VRDPAVLMNDIMSYIEKRPGKTATREEIRLAFINEDTDVLISTMLKALVGGNVLDVVSYKIKEKP